VCPEQVPAHASRPATALASQLGRSRGRSLHEAVFLKTLISRDGVFVYPDDQQVDRRLLRRAAGVMSGWHTDVAGAEIPLNEVEGG